MTKTKDPRPAPKARYAFVSLGCPKNLVDSERMLGLFEREGYELVEEPDGADFVVINTCGFIDQAREESYAAIDEMLALKRQGKTRGVIVTGCLAERQKEKLLAERPELNGVVGVFAREEVADLAAQMLTNPERQYQVVRPVPTTALHDTERRRITPRHFAYLKIAEGCDRHCAFCCIPALRGHYVSKPVEEIVAEARQLSADGVRELILVAQETTWYGSDLDGQPRLRDLLLQLESVDVEWIRLMYFYPTYVDDELIATIAESSRIVPYVDVPLQHINDRMLRRMARRVTRHETTDLLARLRSGIPGVTLRTTLLVGFPGETEEEFDELAQFVEEQRFDRLGVFSYSREPGTPAARFSGQLDKETKERRRARLMKLQQKIVAEQNESRVGDTVQVLIDRAVPDQPGAWIGRTAGDAPDIDGLVFVSQVDDIILEPGRMVRCEIVAAQQYDLVGVTTSKPW